MKNKYCSIWLQNQREIFFLKMLWINRVQFFSPKREFWIFILHFPFWQLYLIVRVSDWTFSPRPYSQPVLRFACFVFCSLQQSLKTNSFLHNPCFIPLSPSDCDTYCKASKGKLKINMKKYCKKDYGKEAKTINDMYFNFSSREPNTRLKQGNSSQTTADFSFLSSTHTQNRKWLSSL